jgi:plasmid replication initiation protein
MAKLLKVVVIIGVIIGAWMLYINYTDKKEKERQAELRRQEQIQKEDEERRRREAEAATAVPTQQPIATPYRAPVTRPIVSKRQEIYAAARDSQVTILQYTEKGNGASIYCQGRELNNLYDFLDALMYRGIMRDIDVNKKNYRVLYDRQGRRTYQATYYISW